MSLAGCTGLSLARTRFAFSRVVAGNDRRSSSVCDVQNQNLSSLMPYESARITATATTPTASLTFIKLTLFLLLQYTRARVSARPVSLTRARFRPYGVRTDFSG